MLTTEGERLLASLSGAFDAACAELSPPDASPLAVVIPGCGLSPEAEGVLSWRAPDEVVGDVALAAHRIDRDDGTFDRQQVEQGRDGDDLIRLLGHLGLGEHETLARREGAEFDFGQLSVLSSGAG